MHGNLTTASRRRARPGPAVVSRARLSAVFPRLLSWLVSLDGTPHSIGRGRGGAGAWELDDSTVSRRHATISWDPARRLHLVTDAGSRNGTFVDARPVSEAGEAGVPLVPGSVLRLGDVLLVYERGDSAEPTPAAWVDTVPGRSLSMRLLRTAIARAAADRAAVLVHGETGTGKEYAVRAVHEASGRRGPLVAVNCAALPAQLVEAQLFGHVRGAFTGASADHPGYFRAAHGGSLFLDEIGELPLELQPKLLRAIQDGVIMPVGAAKPTEVDVRVVAATNRSLPDEVEAGRFRRDLYARLAMWELRVPPLRERRVDLLDWLDRLRGELTSAPDALALHPDAAERVLVHAWPENLRGVARLAHALGGAREGVVEAEDLPAWLAPAEAAEPAAADAAAASAAASVAASAAASAAASVAASAAASVAASVAAPAAVAPDNSGSPPLPSPRSARRQAPSRDRMEQLYAETRGNVREMARVLACERRQVYRWLEAHGLRRPRS